MKITEISVLKSRKIQIEEYEPYNFSFGAKAEVREGEDINQAYAELEKWVDGKIDVETMKWKNPQKLIRNREKLNSNITPF